MTVLEAVSISKGFAGRIALEDVAMRFDPGITVLLGPNGAGKTTFTRIAAGWGHPDRGSVLIDGVVTEPGDARFLQVGTAPQELAVYPTLTVDENLRVFSDLAGVRGSGHRAELCGTLGIGDLMDRPVGELSGGQQRCVHTAIALVADPAVVLLDEPTVGVDIEHRRTLTDAVRSLGAQGRTIVYTTHYLAEVEALQPDKIVVIEAGRVRYDGPVANLLATIDGGLTVTFDRHVELPAILRGRGILVDGTRWEVPDPSETDLAAVLVSLGPTASCLRGVEVRRPDLEAAYLHLVEAARRTQEEHVDAIAS